MAIAAATLISGVTRTTRALFVVYANLRAGSAVILAIAMTMFSRITPREDVYNILWAVVFGFATLNILSLATRRMEPGRRRMTFGELMAVMVVLVSIFLLGWEMLTLFHIFPIKLRR